MFQTNINFFLLFLLFPSVLLLAQPQVQVIDPVQLSCPLAQHSYQWHLKVSNADIAEEDLNAQFALLPPMLMPSTLPQISVVDTGFDAAHYQGLMKAKIFNSSPSNAPIHLGPTTQDQDGHGTAVNSIVAGDLVGVTQWAQVTSYRATTTFERGTADSQHIEDALLKACEQSEVVNLSFGNFLMERVYDVADLLKRPWAKIALQKGCLLIRAAGNSGVRIDSDEFERRLNSSGAAGAVQTQQPTVPLLTVGALSHLGDISSFSSTGSLFAPGQELRVFGAQGTDWTKSQAQTSCEFTSKGLSGRLLTTSGTSFAAPLTAGIAAQVIAQLKLLKVYPAPAGRIDLLKTILLKTGEWSVAQGLPMAAVNAVVALAIAKSYAKNPALFKQYPKIDQLRTQVQTQHCDPSSCRADMNALQCTQHLRRQVALCDVDQLPEQNLLALQHALRLSDDYREVDYYYSYLLKSRASQNGPSSGLTQELLAQELHLQQQWKELLNLETFSRHDLGRRQTLQVSLATVTHFNKAMELLRYGKKLGLPNFVSKEKLFQLLWSVSDGVMNYVGIDSYLKGSFSKVQRSANIVQIDELIDYFLQLSSADQLSLIQEFKIPLEMRSGQPVYLLKGFLKPLFLYLVAQRSLASALALPVNSALQSLLKEFHRSWKIGTLEGLYSGWSLSSQFLWLQTNYALIDLLDQPQWRSEHSLLQDCAKMSFTNPPFKLKQLAHCLMSNLVTAPQAPLLTVDYWSEHHQTLEKIFQQAYATESQGQLVFPFLLQALLNRSLRPQQLNPTGPDSFASFKTLLLAYPQVVVPTNLWDNLADAQQKDWGTVFWNDLTFSSAYILNLSKQLKAYAEVTVNLDDYRFLLSYLCLNNTFLLDSYLFKGIADLLPTYVQRANNPDAPHPLKALLQWQQQLTQVLLKDQQQWQAEIEAFKPKITSEQLRQELAKVKDKRNRYQELMITYFVRLENWLKYSSSPRLAPLRQWTLEARSQLQGLKEATEQREQDFDQSLVLALRSLWLLQ